MPRTPYYEKNYYVIMSGTTLFCIIIMIISIEYFMRWQDAHYKNRRKLLLIGRNAISRNNF